MPVSRALLHFEVLESRFRVLAAFHHLDNAPRLVSSDIVPYDNVAGLNLVVCQMFSLSPRNVPNVRLCASIRISKAICGHRLMFGGVDAQADPAKVEVLADLLSRVAGFVSKHFPRAIETKFRALDELSTTKAFKLASHQGETDGRTRSRRFRSRERKHHRGNSENRGRFQKTFPTSLEGWRPRRDLNPCYRRERAMS